MLGTRWGVTLPAAVVGMISLEPAGHFVGTADPADELFAAVVDRQVRSLRMDASRG